TVMLAYTNATRIATAAQWLWNTAIAANPIGAIIVGIIALVTALYLFFTKTETGRRIWETVWSAIKTAVSAAWEYIKPIWDGFINALGWVGDKLNWLWSNVVSPVLGWIGAKFQEWWPTVQIIWQAFQQAISDLGGVLSWLWSNIVSPVLGWIGDRIA